jgi:hypothetical protein
LVAADALDADVEGVGQGVLGRAVEVDAAREPGGEAGMKVVAQGGDAPVAAVDQFLGGESGGGAQGRGEGDVLGAGAQAAFASATLGSTGVLAL